MELLKVSVDSGPPLWPRLFAALWLNPGPRVLKAFGVCSAIVFDNEM